MYSSASVGLFAESFLQETANQLTYHGLCELNAKVKEDELCVFFRNNHFSTLYKHQVGRCIIHLITLCQEDLFVVLITLQNNLLSGEGGLNAFMCL